METSIVFIPEEITEEIEELSNSLEELSRVFSFLSLCPEAVSQNIEARVEEDLCQEWAH